MDPRYANSNRSLNARLEHLLATPGRQLGGIGRVLLSEVETTLDLSRRYRRQLLFGANDVNTGTIFTMLNRTILREMIGINDKPLAMIPRAIFVTTTSVPAAVTLTVDSYMEYTMEGPNVGVNPVTLGLYRQSHSLGSSGGAVFHVFPVDYELPVPMPETSDASLFDGTTTERVADLYPQALHLRLDSSGNITVAYRGILFDVYW